MKKPMVSVIEDDQFFRESMRRLMRSLGYSVESFPSAADFLASPHLAETDCLIADVHMPVMTGIELYRHLVDAERAIPTILVTAYPNDADRDCAQRRNLRRMTLPSPTYRRWAATMSGRVLEPPTAGGLPEHPGKS